MKKTPFILCLFFLVILPGMAFSQVAKVNELKRALKDATQDSVRCRILEQLVETASDDEWPMYNERLKKISATNLSRQTEKGKEYKLYKKFYGSALNNEGFLLHNKGFITEATKIFQENLKIQEEINDKEGIFITLGNIAALYEEQGQMKEALNYYNQSLKIGESTGNKRGVAHIFNNIGKTYYILDQPDLALDALDKALKIYKEIDDKHGLAMTMVNMGTFHDYRGQYEKALTFLTEGMKLQEEIGDNYAIALTMANIGSTYKKMKKYDQALEFLTKGLAMHEKRGNKPDVTTISIHISKTYMEMALAHINTKQNFQNAVAYGEKGMTMAKQLGFPRQIRESALTLSETYEALGKHEKALENYELYIQMRDSINNDETKKAGIRSQLKYQYEKQAAADSVAHAKENDIKNAELEKQTAEIKEKRILQYVLFGGLAMVLVFAGFMYNRFKITQKQKTIIEAKEKETKKQNEIISEQKRLVEHKQKEILDSINYAKRIQIALITSERYILKNINRLKGNS